MDRTFSASNSTGGALRQYHHHQQQQYQSVRNSSLSPSSLHQLQQPPQQQQFNLQPQQQTSHYQNNHCRISSSNSPVQNNLSSVNNSGATGFGNIGIAGNQIGFSGSCAKDGNVCGGSRFNPVEVASAAAGTFLGVPNYTVQVPSQQKQYYHHQQRTCPNFDTGAASANITATRTGHSPIADTSTFDHCQQQQQTHHLHSNNSRNICGSSPVQVHQHQQQLQDRGLTSQQIIQHSPIPFQNFCRGNVISSSTGHQQAAPAPSINNYYQKSTSGDDTSGRNIKGGHFLHQKESYQCQPQHTHKFSSVNVPPSQKENQVSCPPPVPPKQSHQSHHYQFHSSSLPSSSNSQMPNNNQQSMNKNRYGTSVTAVAATPPPHQNQTGENLNNAASKQLLIQQINQQSQQQQNEMNNDATTTATGGHVQVQQQASPQYRIFKRGDSIPGISSPPIQVTGTNSPNTTGNDNSNSICFQSGNINGTMISSEIVENDIQNGGSDKENSNVSPTNNIGGGNGNGGGGSGNSNSALSRTPLSQIGEIARFHSLSVAYRLVKETGPPHAPTFTVILQLGNEEYSGEGPSIKKAQHAAATEALEKTTLTKPPRKSKSKKPFTINGAGGSGGKRPNWALIQLTNLAQEMQLQLQFVQQPVPIVDPFRRGDPPSIVAVHVGDNVFTGEGANFNAAKNMAVMVALKAMLKIKQEADLAKLTQVGSDPDQSDMENKSPISIVHEMAMKRGLTVSFSIVQESGPPHMKVFTVNCKVGEDMESEGQGPTKQAAKKASSELMIAKLKEIPITLPATSQGINLKAMQRGLLRQKSTKKKTSTPVVKDLEKQTVSPISKLIQIAHIKKYKEPEFVLVSTGTEANVETFIKQVTERDRRMLRKKKPVFTIEVTVGPHTCQGAGSNKKAAKKAAAEAAIIALGYGPTEDISSSAEDAVDAGQSEQTGGNTSTKHHGGRGKGGGGGNNQSEGKVSSPTVKLAGAKQIAPGIIVLKSEAAPGAATSAAAAQEMKKVGGMMMTPSQAASSREGIEKLAYLSNLLEISVSYSDFPKKNEYLSVVSLTTNPPHVAHGCGPTLEEAQNAAALKILDELSTKGLDSVTAAAEKPSDS